ncbi:MAG TPA: glycoside hydrolase family 44 protein, partial [Roseiflexaceae bacterium]
MSPRTRNFIFLALALALIAAIAIPLVRRGDLARLSLAADNQLVVSCATKLTVEVQDGQATLRCAAPGDLAVQQAQQAAQPTAAATPAPSTAGEPAAASASKPIFQDELADDWVNWSWASTIDLAAKTAHAGSAAISVTYTGGWAGLYLHANQPLSTSGYNAVRFWANGGSTGGQKIRVCFINSCGRASDTYTLEANTWKAYDIPLRDVGGPSALNDLIWQDTTGGKQPIYFLDDVALVATQTSGAQPSGNARPGQTGSGPALAVDATADRHAINPLIYGMNFPDPSLAKELGLTVQRWGGNATTRYNWQNDTTNRASDWFFENIPNDGGDVVTLPKGSSSDKFVEQGRQAGMQTILTIPLIGWTSKSRAVACAFATAKYSQQQKTDDQRGCGN